MRPAALYELELFLDAGEVGVECHAALLVVEALAVVKRAEGQAPAEHLAAALAEDLVVAGVHLADVGVVRGLLTARVVGEREVVLLSRQGIWLGERFAVEAPAQRPRGRILRGLVGTGQLS